MDEPPKWSQIQALSPSECGTGVGTPLSVSEDDSRGACPPVTVKKGAESTRPLSSSTTSFYSSFPSTSKSTTICPWGECGAVIEGRETEVYDHIVEDHINTLIKMVTEMKKEKKKNKKKDEDSDEEDDPFSCRWPDCDMALERGNDQRKCVWLHDHLRSRHLIGAATEKCLFDGCPFRTTTKKLLGDHVRAVHTAKKKHKSPTKESRRGMIYYHPADPKPLKTRVKRRIEVKNPDACFGLTHAHKAKRLPLMMDFDPIIDDYFARTLEIINNTPKLRFERDRSGKTCSGSAWRKTKCTSGYLFLPAKEKEEPLYDPSICFDPIAESLMTLDDLFPPPPPRLAPPTSMDMTPPTPPLETTPTDLILPILTSEPLCMIPLDGPYTPADSESTRLSVDPIEAPPILFV